MASRRLEDLHPGVKAIAEDFQSQCASAGVSVLIYCTYRSDAEQAALYAQGRMPLDEVNRLRKVADLAPLGWGENGKIVTKAKPGESAHNHVDENGKPCALAFDCAPIHAGKLSWDDKDPAWGVIGGIGVRLGLHWYGLPNVGFYEKPHFELSLQEAETEASTTGA